MIRLLTFLLFLLLPLVPAWGAPAAAPERPLFPLWPEGRISLKGEEVRRLYRELIQPLNRKAAPRFGNPGQCRTGEMDPAWLDGQQRLLNSYRALAGAPEIRFTAELNAKAALGALITAAGRWPVHHPTPDAPCYTPEGAKATATSSLAYGGIHTSINDWIDDNGVTGVGHRLPTLHPGERTMGIGAVGGGMALLYPRSYAQTDQSHIALWPPAGYVPAPFAFSYPSFTFSLTPHLAPPHTLDLRKAQARVTINGWPRPVTTYAARPSGSFLFEVSYGDKTPLKRELSVNGVVLDVVIGPVTVNGRPAEIRYRTIYFDPELGRLPTAPMVEPGFYPLSATQED